MGILNAAGWAGQRIVRRSQWLAKRLWIITLAEVALLARRHWVRLEPEERKRLTELIRESRGRPSKLSNRDQKDLEQLLDKLGHLELARDAFARVLPIGGSIVRRLPIPGLKKEPEPDTVAERRASDDGKAPREQTKTAA